VKFIYNINIMLDIVYEEEEREKENLTNTTSNERIQKRWGGTGEVCLSSSRRNHNEKPIWQIITLLYIYRCLNNKNRRRNNQNQKKKL